MIIRSVISFVVLSVILLSGCSKRQTEKTFFTNCLSEEKSHLLNNMIGSFEKDVCNYYGYSEKEVDKAIVSYLNELKKSHDNTVILNIASEKSIKLLKKSFKILSNDVWITYEEEYNSSKSDSIYRQYTIDEIDTVSAEDIDEEIIDDDFEIDIPIIEKGEVLEDRLKKDSINEVEMMKKYKNKHYLRIYGKLVNLYF